MKTLIKTSVLLVLIVGFFSIGLNGAWAKKAEAAKKPAKVAALQQTNTKNNMPHCVIIYRIMVNPDGTVSRAFLLIC